MAGSALRTVLSKAAATPLRGTLIVQTASATTMTTIGLVSAGPLTFPQGLGLVFGANIGTTGTGWLVALIGVCVSLTAAAPPTISAGALVKLLGRGELLAPVRRWPTFSEFYVSPLSAWRCSHLPHGRSSG
jgi:phosphate:Na+ symporter